MQCFVKVIHKRLHIIYKIQITMVAISGTNFVHKAPSCDDLHVTSEREFRENTKQFPQDIENVEYGKHADYLKEWQHLITDGPGFPLHVMYYEDLKMDVIEKMNKLLKFLDIELDEKLKKDIIEMCDFQKMAEEKGRDETFTTYSNKDFEFFRKGQVADWKNWFTVAQNEMFDEIWERDVKDADIFKFKYA